MGRCVKIISTRANRLTNEKTYSDSGKNHGLRNRANQCQIMKSLYVRMQHVRYMCVHTCIHTCSAAAAYTPSPECRKSLLQRAEGSQGRGIASPAEARFPGYRVVCWISQQDPAVIVSAATTLLHNKTATTYCCRRVKQTSNTSTLVAPHMPSPEPWKPRGTGVCWWMCLSFEKHRSSRELAGHISGGGTENREVQKYKYQL